ncbi:hypothetical protein CHU98_g530 [Xylaria longipes]|nr:hypothetical protein CHU98_g530 [Xylaria longipes]
MKAHAESTTLANDGDVLSAASNKSLAKRPILIMVAFLIGSVVSGILSEIIQAKRSTIGQVLSDDLNPSCTDFGNSASEQTFALDLAYGNFTFTQAKLIDATWDTVIGQGGRLLHGWILYRCVIYPLLVVAMEISTVTYPYYTTLSFSKASFETLLRLLRTLHLTTSYSVLLCTILLIYTLAYTLFFSLIWGTATGYLSLSHKLYAMPGGDVVPLNSENLSLCWVLDPTRSELSMTTPHIEDGPKFSAILSARPSSPHPRSKACLNISGSDPQDTDIYNLQYYNFSGWRSKSANSYNIWDLFEGTKETSSENFMNIQRCESCMNYNSLKQGVVLLSFISDALTRQFLQIGLDARNWTHFGWETDLPKHLIQRDEAVTLNWWDETESSTKPKCKKVSQNGLYPALRAVTLEETGVLHSTHDSPIQRRTQSK